MPIKIQYEDNKSQGTETYSSPDKNVIDLLFLMESFTRCSDLIYNFAQYSLGHLHAFLRTLDCKHLGTREEGLLDFISPVPSTMTGVLPTAAKHLINILV